MFEFLRRGGRTGRVDDYVEGATRSTVIPDGDEAIKRLKRAGLLKRRLNSDVKAFYKEFALSVAGTTKNGVALRTEWILMLNRMLNARPDSLPKIGDVIDENFGGVIGAITRDPKVTQDALDLKREVDEKIVREEREKLLRRAIEMLDDRGEA